MNERSIFKRKGWLKVLIGIILVLNLIGIVWLLDRKQDRAKQNLSSWMQITDSISFEQSSRQMIGRGISIKKLLEYEKAIKEMMKKELLSHQDSLLLQEINQHLNQLFYEN